jgi:enhancing lycopene biosynthesis protein 2
VTGQPLELTPRPVVGLGSFDPPGAACEVTDGCITCGDVAVALTVLERVGTDARCRDPEGREEMVATELVGDVSPGDRLLVHAKVAIARIGEDG